MVLIPNTQRHRKISSPRQSDLPQARIAPFLWFVARFYLASHSSSITVATVVPVSGAQLLGARTQVGCHGVGLPAGGLAPWQICLRGRCPRLHAT